MSSIVVVFYEDNLPYKPKYPGQLYWSQGEGGTVASTDQPFRVAVRSAAYRSFWYNSWSDTPQPETNTHFLAGFRPALLTVNRNLFGSSAEAEGGRVAETNTHFLARFSPASLTVNRNLFSSSAEAEGGLVVETNQHFVAKFTPVGLSVPSALRQNFDSTVVVPAVVETNPHHIGRFAPTSYLVNRSLFSGSQRSADSVVETNTHFIAKFSSAVYARFGYNSWDTGVPQVETNTHFLAAYRPATYFVNRSLFGAPAEGGVVSETNVSFIARFAPVSLTVDRRLISAPAEGGVVAETNPHFVAQFRPGSLTVVSALRQNAATDFVAAPTVETNMHFLARFRPSSTFVNLALRQNPALDTLGEGTSLFYVLYNAWTAQASERLYYWHQADSPPAESGTNPHFVARFAPSRLTAVPALRQNAATDFAAAVQVEANPHFRGFFRSVTYRLGINSWDSGTPQVETNVSFVAKFAPQQLAVPAALRQNSATDFVAAAPQIEGGPYFRVVARQAAYRTFWFNAWSEGVQPETNPHFVARYSQASLIVPAALRQNAATDFAVAAVQVETNPHFLGFFGPVTYQLGLDSWDAGPFSESGANSHFIARFKQSSIQVSTALRQNAATDFVAAPAAETNTHFVARFVPATYKQFNYNSWDSGVPQRETNTHFLASYRPTVYVVNRSLFGASAEAEGGRVAETNPHFIGTFKPVNLTVLLGLRQHPDAIFVTPPQPETNTHFLATFRPAVYKTFNYNSWDTGIPQRETNVHFLARFSPATLFVNRALFGSAAESEGGRVAETNPHYLAQFKPATYLVDRRLFSLPAEGGTVAETNVHFLARFTPAVYTRFGYNLWDSRVPQVETNVHFLARYAPARLTVNRALFGSAAEAEGGTVAETNVHFLARFTPARFTLLDGLWRLPGGPPQFFIVPDPQFGHVADPRWFGSQVPLRYFGAQVPPRRVGAIAEWPVPQVSDFSEMDVGETVNGWIDFSQWLALDKGEVLATITSVAATNYKPLGGAPYVTLTGPATIGTVSVADGGTGVVNATVLQQWTGAAPGVARISMTATTTAGQTLTAWGHQRVGSPN